MIAKADIINFSASLYFSASCMVMDEAEAYFTGDKTAEEVADILQSRISLMVNEKKD